MEQRIDWQAALNGSRPEKSKRDQPNDQEANHDPR